MSIDNKNTPIKEADDAKVSTDAESADKSEFRKDIVSGDWILVAPKRLDYFLAKRKEQAEKNAGILDDTAKAKEIEICPFEDPQKSGNPEPVLAFDKNGNEISNGALNPNWMVQMIPNKNPALEIHYNACPTESHDGPFSSMEAAGFHDVVITRFHDRHIALLEKNEIEILLRAYKTRYINLADEKCLKYILIFHNHGKEAGASVAHPHSQIMALPIIPPDVKKSLYGCFAYFKENLKCPHCESLEWEISRNERIVYKNEHFIAFCPYSSRANFEIRIFPLEHRANFEATTDEETKSLSDIMKYVFSSLNEKLGNPAYNFFIHTSPINYEHDYHWHIEILPRLSTWGGVELGTGIEVIVVPPEKAADILKF